MAQYQIQYVVDRAYPMSGQPSMFVLYSQTCVEHFCVGSFTSQLPSRYVVSAMFCFLSFFSTQCRVYLCDPAVIQPGIAVVAFSLVSFFESYIYSVHPFRLNFFFLFIVSTSTLIARLVHIRKHSALCNLLFSHSSLPQMAYGKCAPIFVECVGRPLRE